MVIVVLVTKKKKSLTHRNQNSGNYQVDNAAFTSAICKPDFAVLCDCGFSFGGKRRKCEGRSSILVAPKMHNRSEEIRRVNEALANSETFSLHKQGTL